MTSEQATLICAVRDEHEADAVKVFEFERTVNARGEVLEAGTVGALLFRGAASLLLRS